MNPDTQLRKTPADRLSHLIKECADVIFNIVLVMMYKADEEGVILKVNPSLQFRSVRLLGSLVCASLSEA